MAKTPAPPTFADNLRAEAPLIVGWITTAIFFTVGKGWTEDFSNLALTAAEFVWLLVAMIWCAFGVVRHAEIVADYLGEPYGTLILTVSVIAMEVAIMATVMLQGEPNPTLPRDTVYAVLMIVLNGMIGVAVVIGALRHHQQQYNLQGATAFLAVISCLAVISLVLPAFMVSMPGPVMTPLQAVVFGVLTALLYVGFLMIQTTRHWAFFLETPSKRLARIDAADAPLPHDVHGPKNSLGYHLALLVVTLVPVVLLAKPLANLMDFGLEQLKAPVALGGVVIAALVLTPESLSAFQAAAHNQMQRAVNLLLGAALSTIGMTIPVMLAISLITGTPLEVGLPPAEIALLILTLFIAQMTFSGVPTNILIGGVHIVLFVVFVVMIFQP